MQLDEIIDCLFYALHNIHCDVLLEYITKRVLEWLYNESWVNITPSYSTQMGFMLQNLQRFHIRGILHDVMILNTNVI